MGDPPPLVRCPASTANLEPLPSPPPEPVSHPTFQNALRQQHQSRTSSASAAFHKRKSKETNKSSVNSSSGGVVDRHQEEAYDNEDNNTNRGGHEEGVVVSPGLLLDQTKEHLPPQWSLKEHLNSSQHQRDNDTVPPADTIRKRIKFIMGDDEDDDEEVAVGAEIVDQENSIQPPARKSDCKRLCPAPSSSSAAPQLTSKLRLRTSCSQLNMDSEAMSLLLLHQPEHHQKKKSEKNPSSVGSAGQETRGSLSEEQQHKKPKQRKKTARSAPATTNRGTNNSSSSNRTRSRFFSRFNKRTVRAVVLLVVKLCGLLVASILIPSSKQLVTAVNSGFDSDQQQFDQPSAATNLDDMLTFDEYGNAISPLDGYASSTISPAYNGNYPAVGLCVWATWRK